MMDDEHDRRFKRRARRLYDKGELPTLTVRCNDCAAANAPCGDCAPFVTEWGERHFGQGARSQNSADAEVVIHRIATRSAG